MLLFAFGLIALRRRTRATLVAITLYGTIIVSVFFCAGYIATYSDIGWLFDRRAMTSDGRGDSR